MAKILIVEDEVITVFIWQKLLTGGMHEVVDIVFSGENAIEAIKKRQPDIIVMDVFLKGSINGVEAMEEIRKLSEAPVIYTTCLNHKPTIQRALEVKNSRLLRKPVALDLLEATIKELVEEKAYS